MERLTKKVGNTYAVDMPNNYMHEITAKNKLMQNFKKCCEKLGKLEDLEEKIYPLTLEKLVNITLDEANKKEGRKANHIHLLSDEESHKWEDLLKLEERIETMTLEELVNKVVELENTFETSFDEIVEWLYKNTPVVD